MVGPPPRGHPYSRIFFEVINIDVVGGSLIVELIELKEQELAAFCGRNLQKECLL